MVNLGQLTAGSPGRFSLDIGLTVNNGSTASYRSVIGETAAPIRTNASNRRSKTNNWVGRVGGFFQF